MKAAQRVQLLLPDAREASKANTVHRFVSPMVSGLWAEMPLVEPVPIRCAWVEREILRRVPITLAPGELLAGRIDYKGRVPNSVDTRMPDDMFPHGQRAHTALDAEKLIRLGISGVESEIHDRLVKSVHDEPRVFYRSALISLEGFRDLVARLRQLALGLSQTKADRRTGDEMARLAGVLDHVPERPARTFYEAIQATHLLYFAGSLITQSLYGPGRLDRLLLPFYEADLRRGTITRDDALSLICCQFLLMNHLYELPQPVMIGGLGPDGRDTTNELTYLCLEADTIVGLVNPSLAIAVNRDTPQKLLDVAARRLLSGSTKPALFGDETITAGLQQLGVSLKDSCEYIHSTCVEITIVGKSNILVASPYINLLKPLEFALNDGVPMMGSVNEQDVNCHTHIKPPPPDSYESFADFVAEYKRQLAGRIADAAEMMAAIRMRRATGWAFPLASCFTDDCIERGRDLERGGARYTWTETSNVGLANVVDSLSVVKRRVYREGKLTLKDIRNMLADNYASEADRLSLSKGVPRYGNDNREADSLAGEIVDTIYAEHSRHRDGLGGRFVPGFFCWIMHRVLGDNTAASPDGRRAGETLADAAGSAQGRDTSGPTAAVRSITSWDHRFGLGGIVLNLRFAAEGPDDDLARSALVELIRTYFSLGGFEVQINCVGSDTLRAAQSDPASHADLLIRVAGYSDYFTLLDVKMQEEIIRRTAHSR